MFLLGCLALPVCVSQSRCKGTAAALRPTNKQATFLYVVEHNSVTFQEKTQEGAVSVAVLQLLQFILGLYTRKKYALYYIYIINIYII